MPRYQGGWRPPARPHMGHRWAGLRPQCNHWSWGKQRIIDWGWVPLFHSHTKVLTYKYYTLLPCKPLGTGQGVRHPTTLENKHRRRRWLQCRLCKGSRSIPFHITYKGSTWRTVAWLALHIANDLKYSRMRLSGTLVGGSMMSRGKVVACTVVSTKKSKVKAAKVEVVRDFIIETREL